MEAGELVVVVELSSSLSTDGGSGPGVVNYYSNAGSYSKSSPASVSNGLYVSDEVPTAGAVVSVSSPSVSAVVSDSPETSAASYLWLRLMTFLFSQSL